MPVSGVAAVGQEPSNSEPIRSGRPPCAGDIDRCWPSTTAASGWPALTSIPGSPNAYTWARCGRLADAARHGLGGRHPQPADRRSACRCEQLRAHAGATTAGQAARLSDWSPSSAPAGHRSVGDRRAGSGPKPPDTPDPPVAGRARLEHSTRLAVGGDRRVGSLRCAACRPRWRQSAAGRALHFAGP